jgi:hypothetical protein
MISVVHILKRAKQVLAAIITGTDKVINIGISLLR